MKNKKLIIVTGPTASGKTDLAIAEARSRGCPVISADSRQVYKELDIGVARPSPAQLSEVRHYLIAHVSIHDEYNAGTYAKEAREIINALFLKHDELVVCGGTGLYIKALLHGMDPLPGKDDELRQVLTAEMNESGLESLQKRLKELDPEKYAAVDIRNPQRLIRAIEIAMSPAPPATDIPPFDFSFEKEVLMTGLGRAELYERINDRVDQMIRAGLENEARQLYPFRNLNALQTVGYTEWWPYFEGRTDLPAVLEKIKQHTRNYAKRQLTWFRNQVLW